MFFRANLLAKHWKTKTNTTKQTCIHNKIYYNIKWIPPKKLQPGLVINLSLTYLDTYPLTYSPGTHTQRESNDGTGSCWKKCDDQNCRSVRERQHTSVPCESAVRSTDLSTLWSVVYWWQPLGDSQTPTPAALCIPPSKKQKARNAWNKLHCM